MKNIIFYLSISFLFIVFILELGIRFSGKHKVYSEKNGLGYISYYGDKNERGLHTWTPNSTIDYQQTEFNIQFETNSLGLREKEFDVEKAKGVFRIIFLGDSFAEGDGTTRENAIPAVLENILNNNSDISIRYEVMNAGVSGSDIIYMNRLFETKLLAYQPDAVIYFLNTSDINDIMIRGGEERFQEDGSSVYKEAPWFQPIYKYSHLIRAILSSYGVQENLMSQKANFEGRQKSVQIFNEALKLYEQNLNKKQIKSAFMVHPFPQMIKHTPSYAIVDSILFVDNNIKFGQNPTHINNNVLKNKILINIFPKCFDVFKPLKYESYAWPINGHYNDLGYQLLAEILYQKIVESDSAFFNF